VPVQFIEHEGQRILSMDFAVDLGRVAFRPRLIAE
jgi:hypothetical protein